MRLTRERLEQIRKGLEHNTLVVQCSHDELLAMFEAVEAAEVAIKRSHEFGFRDGWQMAMREAFRVADSAAKTFANEQQRYARSAGP